MRVRWRRNARVGSGGEGGPAEEAPRGQRLRPGERAAVWRLGQGCRSFPGRGHTHREYKARGGPKLGELEEQ